MRHNVTVSGPQDAKVNGGCNNCDARLDIYEIKLHPTDSQTLSFRLCPNCLAAIKTLLKGIK
jgi:hypothetical protein